MYILTFGASLLLLYLSEKWESPQKKICAVVLAILIPSLLAGLRDYTVGTDVLLYGNTWFLWAREYSSMTDYLAFANASHIGIGYAFVNFVVSRVSGSPHVFYFVYETMQLTVLYFAIAPFKPKVNLVFAFALYYFSYYNSSLNLLRQIMAMILVLLSYRFVVGRKPIWYILTILIAFSFHSTAVVGFALYPISWAVEHPKYGNIARAVIFTGTFALVLGYRQVLYLLIRIGILSADRYLHYLTDSVVGGRFVRLVYWGVISFLTLWCFQRRGGDIPGGRTLSTLAVLSALISIVMFVGSARIIRAAYYFDILQVLYLPVLANNLDLSELANKLKLPVLANKLNLPVLAQKLNLSVIDKKTVGYVLVTAIVVLNWLLVFIIRNGAHTFPYVFMKG